MSVVAKTGHHPALSNHADATTLWGMSQAQSPPTGTIPAAPSLPGTLRHGVPLVLYGIRLWIAVCLALFVAFRLELQNPFWAGTSAAIVCQPAVGASFRKGWFRLIGTVIGAVMAVVLTACFPQSRAGFLLSLALWGAACALVATLLHNFASYAAALSGFTAAIVASDEMGLVGGVNGDAFMLAITRAIEISVGIVCAGFVLAGTDFGGARRQLATALVRITAEIAAGLRQALSLPPNAQATSRPVRRSLRKSVAGLSTLMDQAAGEISAIPFRPQAFNAVTDGLFATLSAWRAVAGYIQHHPQTAEEADTVLKFLPVALVRSEAWQNPLELRDHVLQAARRLVALPATSPSTRLLADRSAEGLLGLARALTGIAFLAGMQHLAPRAHTRKLRVPDWLPPVYTALRAFVTIVTAWAIWIATGWPGGPTMALFATITVILFAPREDAFAITMEFLIGTGAAAVCAAVIGFAVLPLRTSFGGFAASLGLVLVPAGALSAQAWHQPLFFAMAAIFIPLLGPANPESYDPVSFYNLVLALLSGVTLGMIAFPLMPPLSPELRARRLVGLTLRDLRRLATGRLPRSSAGWEARVYGRVAAMPAAVDPMQQARLGAALAMGTELIRLRRMAQCFHLRNELWAALEDIAAGRSEAAIANLARFETALADVPGKMPDGQSRLRAHATIQAIADSLRSHASYFNAQVQP
jgi:uncharacterized membrane protein YccC